MSMFKGSSSATGYGKSNIRSSIILIVVDVSRGRVLSRTQEKCGKVEGGAELQGTKSVASKPSLVPPIVQRLLS